RTGGCQEAEVMSSSIPRAEQTTTLHGTILARLLVGGFRRCHPSFMCNFHYAEPLTPGNVLTVRVALTPQKFTTNLRISGSPPNQPRAVSPGGTSRTLVAPVGPVARC